MIAGDKVRVQTFVKVAIADAFAVFTLEIDQWWRRGRAYRIGVKHPGTLHLEPKLGGRLFEQYGEGGTALHEIGTITAWVLVRDDFRGKPVVNAIIDLPFALPTIVAGLTLLALYGPGSPLGINVAFTKASRGVMTPLCTISISASSISCMPSFLPDCISDCSMLMLFSRIRFGSAEVRSRISTAARRPLPSAVGISSSATKPAIDSESVSRTWDC